MLILTLFYQLIEFGFMKTGDSSSKSLDVEIKKLELEIAKLRLDLAEKEKQKELLEEFQTTESVGIDRHECPVFEGDIVKILTPSRKGSFKGVEHAVVIGRSKRHSQRVLIGKIEKPEVTTNRESYNLLVVTRKNEFNSDRISE